MDTFPRQSARTRRYSLGRPHGSTSLGTAHAWSFLRSRTGSDPARRLWVFDVAAGVSGWCSAGAEAGGELTQEERDRRERAGEKLDGVIGYAADRDARVAAFVSGGRLMLADLVEGSCARTRGRGARPFDPRIDPAGRAGRVRGRGCAPRARPRRRARTESWRSDDDPDVSWGLAEFIAAEEMERRRGYWWSPDGEAVAAARVDERPVRRRGTSPTRSIPRSRPEPSATRLRGPPTPRSRCSVRHGRLRADVRSGRRRVPVPRDGGRGAERSADARVVQSRDQRTCAGARRRSRDRDATLVREDQDERWLHIVPASRGGSPDGRLLRTQRLRGHPPTEIDDEPVTPVGLQVEEVLRRVTTTSCSGRPRIRRRCTCGAGDADRRALEGHGAPGIHTRGNGGSAP